MPRRKALTLKYLRRKRRAKAAAAKAAVAGEQEGLLNENTPKRKPNLIPRTGDGRFQGKEQLMEGSEQEAGKPCNCRERMCDLELRICAMEQRLERLLGQMGAVEPCTQLTPHCSEMESVVMGQPGAAPPIPLHEAAEHGDTIALVRALVRGEDPNALDRSKDTALHCAVRSGEALSVELLLAAGASLDTPDARGATPLAIAVCRGHQRTVEILLERGAQMEQHDKDGRTPLMRAVDLRNAQMVSLLVKHGASVNALDCHGRSPLITAARECLLDILTLLICHSNPSKAQMRQAMNVAGSSAAFMNLVQAVPTAATRSVNCSNLVHVAKEGWLRPIYAIINNCVQRRCHRHNFHSENIQRAIMVAKTEGILDVLWKSAPGTTRQVAMSRAAAMGWNAVLERIVCHWKASKKLHFSEIMGALCNVKTPEAAFLLVEAHPHVALTSMGCETASHAAEHGWYKVLEVLIDNGVPVDCKKNGSSLLRSAASRGNRRCVEMLVSRGASVQERDDDGWTPLHYAAEGGHSYVVDILLKKGADPSARDPFGLTPYDVATTDDIINLLKPVQ